MEEEPKTTPTQEQKILKKVEGLDRPTIEADVPDPAERLEDIKSEVKEVDSKIESELAHINEIRARFAMPPLDTTSEVEQLRSKREQLRSVYEKEAGVPLEEEKIAQEQKETEAVMNRVETAKQEETEKQERYRLQKELSNIEESFSRLSSIFGRREGNQLSPLLERGDVSNISFGARSLAEAAKAGSVDYGGIAQALGSIRRGLENFGQYRNAGPMREDGDSLGAISVSLQETNDAMQRLRGILAESKTSEAQEAAASIGPLSKTLEEVWHQTAKRREMLSQYSGDRW